MSDATYAAERAAAHDDAEMRAFLRTIGATHFWRLAHLTREIVAYKPGFACLVLPPDARTPRWRILRGCGWKARGRMSAEAEAV